MFREHEQSELVYETWRSRTPEQCTELSTAMFYDAVLYAGREITTNPATEIKKLIFRDEFYNFYLYISYILYIFTYNLMFN